uniref:Sm domain-containing protein n=1 Tax=Timema tahoe TaxID=61484 RepID=A0A7R9NYK0_9NEOP|nr:unnamed protein product [Timema tahoe]
MACCGISSPKSFGTAWFYSVVGLKTQSQAKQHYTDSHDSRNLSKLALFWYSLRFGSLTVFTRCAVAEPVLAPRKQRPERNLLTRMRNTLTGPLARLRDCTELRARVKGQNKVRTVLPPVQGQIKVRTRSYHPFRVKIPPVLGQSKVRTMLPPVLDQSKVKTESYHQTRVRERVRARLEHGLTTRPGSKHGLTTRPGPEQGKNSLTTRPSLEQGENILTTSPGSEKDKSLTTRSGSEQDKTRVPLPVQGQSKVRTFLQPVQGQNQGSEQDKNRVIPPVQGQSKVRTESYHQSRVREISSLTIRPGSKQDKNRVLPPVQGQSQGKNIALPPAQGQRKLRTQPYHASRVRARVKVKVRIVLPSVQGQRQGMNSLTTRAGSEKGKNIVLPPVQGHSKGQSKGNNRVLPPVLGQNKVRTLLPAVQGQSKVSTEFYDPSRIRTRSEQDKNIVLPPVQNGAPGSRTSNQLIQTRILRRQSRLDWLSKTGLESRSGVVKVVFPFSLHYGESKMYRRRSYIPEMVGLVARDNVMLVYIRNMKGIRGYCIAFVAAFDKHWNLALEDVTEVWTRPIKRKAVALGGPSPELQVQPSRVQVVKKDRRTETCERHVSQLMVRGEQVALIAILD